MTHLDDILKLLQSFDGISRKFVLPSIIDKLRMSSFRGDTPHGLGEDSAAIGTESDELILLTTDAIVEDLCLKHPHAAGFNAVLANVMDIYAAGGTPPSSAVALSYSAPKIGEALLAGLIKGPHTFNTPIVRGHTNPNSTSTYVVGSATGTVQKKNILTAGGANDGDVLVILFDRTGQRGVHYQLGWDSVTDRPSENVVKRLTVMNDIAERDLVTASKDVSVAGIVGTAAMMLEYSGKGGVIDLDAIDQARPKNIVLEDWLRMYISLGFLVATKEESFEELKKVATEHDLSACRIGVVDDTRIVKLSLTEECKIMFDFTKGPVLTPRTGHD